MSLYNKHLKSIDDLRKERAALRKQAKKLKKNPVRLNSLIPKATGEQPGGQLLSMALNLISGNGSVLAAAAPLLLGLIRKTPVTRIAKSAATGLVGGYLKWKAITLGLKLAKSIIISKKKETTT